MAIARSQTLSQGLARRERRRAITVEPEFADAALDGSLLFAEDVAAMVGMTRKWVYVETRAGRIPHVALGRYYRYRPESIDAWLRQIERRRA
jgi:excisionase family DNA binding protein